MAPRILWILLLIALDNSALAADYSKGQLLYVIASSANLRAAPNIKAEIRAKILIGRKVFVRKIDQSNQLNPWLRVGLVKNSYGHDNSAIFNAWISSSVLAVKPPKLDDLIRHYRSTPENDLAGRKKWAERAIAFNPMNQTARTIYLEVLNAEGNKKLIEQSQVTFAKYDKLKVQNTAEDKTIFLYKQSGILEPIAVYKNSTYEFKRLNFSFDDNLVYGEQAFYQRGTIYNLYTFGESAGYVITEIDTLCGKKCLADTWARRISSKNIQSNSSIAVNYALPERKSNLRKITKSHKQLLVTMAKSWLKKNGRNWSEKINKEFFDRGRFALAQFHQQNKIYLLGNWVVGDKSSWRYSNELYENLMIIAEENAPGQFVPVFQESLIDSGCRYINYADLDGDGDDEIMMLCEGVESEHYYGIGDRFNGKWVIHVSDSLTSDDQW